MFCLMYIENVFADTNVFVRFYKSKFIFLSNLYYLKMSVMFWFGFFYIGFVFKFILIFNRVYFDFFKFNCWYLVPRFFSFFLVCSLINLDWQFLFNLLDVFKFHRFNWNKASLMSINVSYLIYLFIHTIYGKIHFHIVGQSFVKIKACVMHWTNFSSKCFEFNVYKHKTNVYLKQNCWQLCTQNTHSHTHIDKNQFQKKWKCT